MKRELKEITKADIAERREAFRRWCEQETNDLPDNDAEYYDVINFILQDVLSALIKDPTKVETIGRRTLCLAYVMRHESIAGFNPVVLAKEIKVTKQCLYQLIGKLGTEFDLIFPWQRSDPGRKNMRLAALKFHAKRRRREKWEQQLPLKLGEE